MRPADEGPTNSPIPRLILTPDGVGEIEPSEPHAHHVIDRHWEAVAWFFATDDAARVDCFRGLAVSGATLAADPGVLRLWPALVRVERAIRKAER